MSTAYYVYAEIQVDGKWYNLSPTMKRPDGTFSVEPIYWAQSSFFDVYNDLESHSIGWGIPDDMLLRQQWAMQQAQVHIGMAWQ